MRNELVKVVDLVKYQVLVIDLSDINDEDAINIKSTVLEIGVNSDEVIGLIFYAESLFSTPFIRRTGKELSLELQKINRYIGGVIYGVNEFNKMVARLASKKVQFADTKDESFQVLNEMFEGERPNYLHK